MRYLLRFYDQEQVQDFINRVCNYELQLFEDEDVDENLINYLTPFAWNNILGSLDAGRADWAQERATCPDFEVLGVSTPRNGKPHVHMLEIRQGNEALRVRRVLEQGRERDWWGVELDGWIDLRVEMMLWIFMAATRRKAEVCVAGDDVPAGEWPPSKPAWVLFRQVFMPVEPDYDE